MTSKESDSLNLHNFLPTKTPRLLVVPTFVASKVHSKDRHALLTVCCATCFALGYAQATNCLCVAVDSTSNTCWQNRNTCKEKETFSCYVSQDMFAIGHKDGTCFTRPFLWNNKKVLLKGTNINTRVAQPSTCFASGLKGFSTVPLHGKISFSAKEKVLILKTKTASKSNLLVLRTKHARRRTADGMGSAMGVEHITRASFGTKKEGQLRPLHAKQVRESFALRATTCQASREAIKQSTRNDLSEKRNSVLLNACATHHVLLGTKTIASSAVERSTQQARKPFKQVLDNVKTKHVLKPVPSCWVENRNKNGKPFNSHLDKQPCFSSNKLLERDQRSASQARKSQFQKNTLVPSNTGNKLLTNRTQIKTPKDFDKAKTGVIYLTYTSNNTVCTLVDFKGVTKGWSSCGSLGFKSARKSTAYASQATTERIGLKAKEVGFKWAFLVLKGVGRGKESGVRALRKSGIEILGILEKTGIPHNGCRAPRKRRI